MTLSTCFPGYLLYFSLDLFPSVHVSVRVLFLGTQGSTGELRLSRESREIICAHFQDKTMRSFKGALHFLLSF